MTMSTPGFVGKIPSQGDFVHRRLPWEFIETWDAWLQAGMGSAREGLGTAWLEHYLVAPIWRFLLPAGTVDKSGWIGLWFPSVDRVGRHFPLTVAAPIAAARVDPALLFTLDNWLTHMEEVALEALNPGMTLEQIDANLAKLALSASDDPLSRDVSQVAGHNRIIHIPDSLMAPAQLARHPALAASPGRTTAYWHTWGTEAIPSTYLATEGLPGTDWFSACLTGNWTACGVSPTKLV